MALPLALGLALPAEAVAKNWAVDYTTSLEGTNNIQQQSLGSGDLAWRNQLELSYFPAADADNSALFRAAVLNSRFRMNPDFNSTFILGTALASRRLYGASFGYGGYQLIYKQGDAPSAVNRADNDLFGGFVTYHPINDEALVFHGYQFDFLRAAVNEASYQGHSAYAAFKHQSGPRWSNQATLRGQLRLMDGIGEMDLRALALLESSYRVTDWWALEAQAILTNSTSTVPGGPFAGWNLGLFSRWSI